MKSVINNTDEIEVVDERNTRYGRIKIREYERRNDRHTKASIFLSPDQLEEHARQCLALAESMRRNRT